MGECKDRYRAMFDRMAQGAFFQLADGSMAEVNDAALAMLGLSRDEFLGRTSETPEWRIIREDGSKLPSDQYPSMAALRTGQPVLDFVAGVYSPKQCLTWLNINALPIFRDGETAPYQVFVTLHDISEQKRITAIHHSRIHLMQFADSHSLEELLVEALDELEKLTGSVIGFYHFYDAKTRQVTLKGWSTGTSTLFCGAKSVGGHYHIEQAGVWVDCIRTGAAVIHNDYASLPHRRGLPQGHAPLIRELVVPVKRNGRTVAILGMGNKPADYSKADVEMASLFADLTWDIAERKRAEMRLLQATRELEILTSTSMEGYFAVDVEGRIVSVNDTSCQMRGYSREEMLAMNLCDVDASENVLDLRAHLALIKERGYDRFETLQYHKNGGIMHVEVNAAYIPESGLILAFTRDVTEQKQLQVNLLKSQNDLQQANEFLEQRVNQRTADLRAAIHEQESFSYSVSHDLRAPLRHINSFSAILLEEYGEALPTQALHYLERIRSGSNQMGALIDHLLELSRVTRTALQPGEVNLSDLAAATFLMLEETEPHRRVEQSVKPGITVLGDHHLLSQLLGNLLGNAWKYTSRTTSARIEFGQAILDGQEVCFVRDNGAGFDMVYQTNLFKAFERLHGSEFEGIGIGLATAQRIVQRHGGKIWAEGKVGEGATFYFTLPVYF